MIKNNKFKFGFLGPGNFSHFLLVAAITLIIVIFFDKVKFKQNLATGAKLTEFGQELAGAGGAYQTGWCSSPDCEAQLKSYKASIRCVLAEKTQASCFNCAEFSKSDVIVAKSY